MNKVTTAIVAPEAPATTPAAPAATIAQPKPDVMTLTGPAWTTMNKMAALIRMGYVPLSIEKYHATGHMHVGLQLGNPDPTFTEAAGVELAEAIQLAEIQRTRDIEKAADQLLKERDQAARKAEMAAKVATAEAALAALKAAAAA